MEDILKITKTRGHAGEDETSAMMYYNESLVDMSDLYKNNHRSKYRVYFKDSGFVDLKYAITGDPAEASRQKGELIFDMLEEKMCELVDFMENETYLVNNE
jgi:creatinine amidohydrolase